LFIAIEIIQHDAALKSQVLT